MDLSNDMNHYVERKWAEGLYQFSFALSQIPHLVNLTLGEPSFSTPQHIKQAAIRAIQGDHSHYTEPRGLLALRVNASQFLKQKYGLDYDPTDQILVTTGVSEGINSTLSALLNPGDEVIVPTPIYPFYVPNIRLHLAKPIFLDTAADHFLLTPKKLARALEIHPHTKAIILNYPNDPTGTTYTKNQLIGLARVIRHYRIFCLCDEIYSELVYDHPHYSLGRLLPDQSIVMNGISKTFAMTGWRIGLVCGPAKVITRINKVHAVTVTTATTFAQYAASEAFKNGIDDDQRMLARYRVHRKILARGLKSLGFQFPHPAGAFYIFAKLPPTVKFNSMKFALKLAGHYRVGIVPGNVFLSPGSQRYLRISYAASLKAIRLALSRIRQMLIDEEGDLNA